MIHHGSVAPFDGALVDEAHYREYQNCMDARPILEQRLSEAAQAQPIQVVPPSFGDKVLYFLFGAAIGASAVALTRR